MTESFDFIPNPEAAWIRPAPLPAIDAEFLEFHLADWPGLSSRRWELLGGGLRSLNLRSGDLVARIALEADHDLRKEAALLRAVGSTIRVPQVIEIGNHALLLEFIDVCELPATEQAGFSIGVCAASIHSHRFPQAGFLNENLEVARGYDSALLALQEWFDELMQKSPSASDPGIRQVRLLWEENAQMLGAIDFSPVLVHSDFKPVNVKWSPIENCPVIFDWEFAWAGPNLFDLGQLFRWNPPPHFIHEFESGYRSNGGELHDGWMRDAELFDLLNLINFIIRGIHDPTQNRDIRRRIAATLKRHGKS